MNHGPTYKPENTLRAHGPSLARSITQLLVATALLALLLPLAFASAKATPVDWLAHDLLDAEGIALYPYRMGGSALRLVPPAADGGAPIIEVKGRSEGEGGGEIGCSLRGPFPETVEGLKVEARCLAGEEVSVGLGLSDHEGENFKSRESVKLVPGGPWTPVSIPVAALAQGYPQPEKNKTVDQPVGAMNLILRGRGEVVVQFRFPFLETSLGAKPPPPSLRLRAVPSDAGALRVWAVARNPGEKPCDFTVDARLIARPDGEALDLPDADLGRDFFSVCKIAGEADGQPAKSDPGGELPLVSPYGGNPQKLVVTVTFDHARPARRVEYFRMNQGDDRYDLEGQGEDGAWKPLGNLTDLKGGWGWTGDDLPGTPIKGLRFVFRNPAAKKKITGFGGMRLYDGPADDGPLWPPAEKAAWQAADTVACPARACVVVPLKTQPPANLSAGGWALAARSATGEKVTLSSGLFFRLPKLDTALRERGKSFLGVNSSGKRAAEMGAIGMRFARFENLKWPFTSPRESYYNFTGETPPWRVDHQAIFEGFRKAGLDPLPFLFMTANWNLSVPDGKRAAMYPPKDNAKFAEFVFQSVARFGAKKHPDTALLTTDKASGLGLVREWEIWNEPDLDNPNWGAWVAPLDQYFPLLRAGYEAAKQADPAAIVVNGGLAGSRRATWERIRKFRFEDGKSPLDFTDALNFHHYFGNQPPERNRSNTNINWGQGGPTPPEEEMPFSERLAAFRAWRDAHAPAKPIWFTETGWDTLRGKNRVTEAQQARYLVRVLLLCLSEKIDRVYVYREDDGASGDVYSSCGFLRPDGAAKPSYGAIANFNEELADAKFRDAWFLDDTDRLRGMRFDTAKGPLLALWAVDGAPARVKVPVGRPHVTLVDLFGGTRREATSGGAIEIEVTEAPVYVRDFDWTDALAARAKLLRDAEARRKAEEAARATKKAFLFDFGCATTDAVMMYGSPRAYVAVPATMKFEAARGFGWAKPPTQDKDEAWRAAQGKVQRDLMEFAVVIPPGAWEARVLTCASGDEGELVLNVGGAGRAAAQREAIKGRGTRKLVTFPIQVDREGQVVFRFENRNVALCGLDFLEK